MNTARDRFRGCLLGGAVGDALGGPVEFMSRDEIQRSFGSQGVIGYLPAYGGLGRITDDTQLTLFTAEGLLRSWVRSSFSGIANVPDTTRCAYARWLRTQDGVSAGFTAAVSPRDGWLLQQQALHDRRAPGTTCLAALRAAPTDGGMARNDSKGCGSVMRMAPVGMYFCQPDGPQMPRQAFALARELAGLTHGHPTAQLAAGAFAVLILALTTGAALEEGLAQSRDLLLHYPQHEETLRALAKAERLANSVTPHAEAIAALGQGWVAEEALAIAVYCALAAHSFREGVLLAVNHGGDSDSTGAMAGNLLGAMHGVSAIPAEWLEPLELREVITEMADDLLDYRDWDIGEDAQDDALNERIWRKYPGS